jgi:hypothetical protein
MDSANIRKGVFLERITGSTQNSSQIIWDSSYSPLGFHRSDLQNVRWARPDKDVILRYVPMVNAAGISVSWVPGEILTIMAHTAEPHPASDYRKSHPEAVWMYCPLTNDKVKEVWWVYPDILRTSALIASMAIILHLPRLTSE